MFTSEELSQKVVNAANLDQVMIAAFELNKTRTNHQRTDDNVEKERLYVQAELDKGDAILIQQWILHVRPRNSLLSCSQQRILWFQTSSRF